MKYAAVVLLLILAIQKIRMRNILHSLGWNLTAAGYCVWMVWNLLATFARPFIRHYWWLDYALQVAGFVLLIWGAEVLIRDLKKLGKKRGWQGSAITKQR